jgi:hypothetical protein
MTANSRRWKPLGWVCVIGGMVVGVLVQQVIDKQTDAASWVGGVVFVVLASVGLLLSYRIGMTPDV